GDEQRAIGYYARALENNHRISSAHGEAETLIHLGRVHLSLGETEKGLASFRTALQLFESLGRVRMESVALSDIGKALGLLARDVEALDYYTRALTLYEASGFRREEASALNDVGRIEERRGRVETAVRHYRRALALSRETQDRFAESQSLLNLARIARASGDLDQARRDAEQALGLAEELRSNVASYALRASYFASIHELHEFYVDLLMELHGKRPSEGFDRLAFQASEKARARSLLETLSEEQPDGRDLDPKLLERRAQLERKIRASAGAWEKRTGRAAVGEAPASSSSELDELLAELDRVRAVIRSQAPGYDLLESGLASAEEIQNELLDSSTLMLSYFLGADRSFLWALTRTTLAVHVLPPREEIETRVQTLYRLLAARERIQDETAKEYYQRVSDSDREFWESASLLSTELLGPVVGELGTKRLVIVGDGALHHFPFSALPIPAPAGDSDALPLIAEHEIVRLPSASTLVALKARDLARPKPPKTVAILADPVFDRQDPRVETKDPGAPVAKALPVSSSAWALTRALEDVGLGEGESVPRLLASQQEAKGILSMVPPEESLAALGFDASRALATSGELTQYQVIHFATHGILNTKQPELSGIILSMVDEQGNPQDGFLRLHDIETLHLPANLVVLSACSSGLGKEVKGEGMIGLVRGFMSAGADRVLASYWNVDDEATAELMKRFYGNLFTRSLAPAAALREAQRSMWQEKRWRSPFYWAAFELQGQWQ
ncbi:MAG TPA: CHAT domain-containing tetratricopeptide repeat protein, partial [Vicinamibacteria bacterium]|nr:CHAT domain-containing tetratricopeptide repeat protein [Vicinamibacteria bacterium]